MYIVIGESDVIILSCSISISSYPFVGSNAASHHSAGGAARYSLVYYCIYDKKGDQAHLDHLLNTHVANTLLQCLKLRLLPLLVPFGLKRNDRLPLSRGAPSNPVAPCPSFPETLYGLAAELGVAIEGEGGVGVGTFRTFACESLSWSVVIIRLHKQTLIEANLGCIALYLFFFRLECGWQASSLLGLFDWSAFLLPGLRH